MRQENEHTEHIKEEAKRLGEGYGNAKTSRPGKLGTSWHGAAATCPVETPALLPARGAWTRLSPSLQPWLARMDGAWAACGNLGFSLLQQPVLPHSLGTPPGLTPPAPAPRRSEGKHKAGKSSGCSQR